MPVIAQIMFKMSPDGNGEIKIIEILNEKIHRCGCLDLVTESKKLDTPVGHLIKVMRSIDGVVCTDAGVCCTANVNNFADKLKKFRSKP
jgi:hypothetical protein